MTNMNQKASPLLIVGSMAFDDLELPTINAKNVVGGSATYSAYAASVFSPVRIVAVVGDDFPSGDLEALYNLGTAAARAGRPEAAAALRRYLAVAPAGRFARERAEAQVLLRSLAAAPQTSAR